MFLIVNLKFNTYLPRHPPERNAISKAEDWADQNTSVSTSHLNFLIKYE